MSDLFSIFNPGHQFLVEERERRRLDMQIPGSAAPPFGIDLEAGVVYLDPTPHAGSTEVPGPEDDEEA